MDALKLPPERLKELRDFCLQADGSDRDLIEAAAFEASPDAVAGFIVQHVTSTDHPWRILKAQRIPIDRDNFRLRRAGFYFILNGKLGAPKKDPPPPCPDAGAGMGQG